jgi:hypothetical protein
MYLNAPDGSMDVGPRLARWKHREGAVFLIQGNMGHEYCKSAIHWKSSSSSIPVTLLSVCHENCFVTKVYIMNSFVINITVTA